MLMSKFVHNRSIAKNIRHTGYSALKFGMAKEKQYFLRGDELPRESTALSYANRIIKGLSLIGLPTLLIMVFSAFSPKVREAILNRDEYTCQSCGQQGGAKSESKLRLHLAHIDHQKIVTSRKGRHQKPKRNYDKADNGRVLCVLCHLDEHILIAQAPGQTHGWIDPIIRQLESLVTKGIYFKPLTEEHLQEVKQAIYDRSLDLAQLGIIVYIGEEPIATEKAQKIFSKGARTRTNIIVSEAPLPAIIKLNKQGAQHYRKFTQAPYTGHVARLDYRPKERKVGKHAQKHNKHSKKHHKK